MGVAYVFFARGLEPVPPLSALLISTLEPLLNPVWVMLIYGEVPGPFALTGAVVVIASVLVYNMVDMKKRAAEQTTLKEHMISH